MMGKDLGASVPDQAGRASHGASICVESPPSGGHPSRVSGLGAGRRNDWQTPPEIFAALGCHFDLDVAAPLTGPLHVPTLAWLYERGLERPWAGFVWMNPPFGGRNGIRPWLDKFLRHGNGIALTPDRVSAPWFQEAWDRPAAILFTPKTPFLLPGGEKAGNPAFGNALWAVGERGVTALQRSAESGFGKICFPASAMSAGTAETQSGSGLQPASAVPVRVDAQQPPPSR